MHAKQRCNSAKRPNTAKHTKHSTASQTEALNLFFVAPARGNYQGLKCSARGWPHNGVVFTSIGKMEFGREKHVNMACPQKHIISTRDAAKTAKLFHKRLPSSKTTLFCISKHGVPTRVENEPLQTNANILSCPAHLGSCLG